MEPVANRDMNMDKLTQIILKQPPAEWPRGVQQAITDSPPESVDAAILARIRQEPESLAILPFKRFRFPLAAAATLVMTLGAFVWFTSGPGLAVEYAGAVIVQRQGKIVQRSERVAEGDHYTTGPRGAVVMKQGRKVFRLLADSQAILRNTRPLQVEILEGALILDSGGEHNFTVHWRGMELKPLGTQARIEVRGDILQVSLLSGAFALNNDLQTYRINANEKVLVSSEKITQQKLSPAEIKTLEAQFEWIGDTSAASLSSIASIRKFYGSIQSVRLRDGTQLIGFYFVRNGQPFLHAESGLISLSSKQIQEIQPILSEVETSEQE
ncbi:MAG: FecR family protein [Spirochaetia bacterium]|nr:FecR family protein [Spirochaetia bacterium]